MEARHKTKERAKQALKEHEISQQSSSSDDSDIEEVAPKIVDPEPQQKSVYFTAESTAQRFDAQNFGDFNDQTPDSETSPNQLKEMTNEIEVQES